MSRVCKKFEPNAWSKDLCSNCLKKEQNHPAPSPEASSQYEVVNVFCQIPGATRSDAPSDSSPSQDIHSSHPDVVQSCHDYENELVLEPLDANKSDECSLLDEVLGAVKDANAASHYYHTYDVTMRDKNSSTTNNQGDVSADVTPSMAVPYNVVDIAGDETLSKPRIPQSKPDMTKGAAAKRSMFHGDVIRATSPAVMRNKINQNSSEPTVTDAYEEIDVPMEGPIEIKNNKDGKIKPNRSPTTTSKLSIKSDFDRHSETDTSDREASPLPRKKDLNDSPNKPTGKQKKGFFSRWLKKGSQNESGESSMQSSLESNLDSPRAVMSSEDGSDSPKIKGMSSPRTDPKLLADIKSNLNKHPLTGATRAETMRNENTASKPELNRAQSTPTHQKELTTPSEPALVGILSRKNRSHSTSENDDDGESSTLTRESMRRSKRQGGGKPEKPQKPGTAPPPPPNQKLLDMRPSSSLRSSTPPGKRTAKSSPNKHVTLNLHGDVIRNTGKLAISSPKLQRTSVNLEASEQLSTDDMDHVSVVSNEDTSKSPPVSPGTRLLRMQTAPPPPPSSGSLSPGSRSSARTSPVSPGSPVNGSVLNGTIRSMSHDSTTRPVSPPPNPPGNGIKLQHNSFSLDYKQRPEKCFDHSIQRHNTVSEGFSVDMDDVKPERHIVTTLDRQMNKYSQRALPSPPRKSANKTMPNKHKGRHSKSYDFENFYETVPYDDIGINNVSKSPPISAFAKNRSLMIGGSAYEDIEYEDEPPRRTLHYQGSHSSEYLEPVSHQGSFDRHSLLSEMNFSEDGTPMLSPRLPRSFHTNSTHLTGEQYVLLYANKEILADKTQSPVNIRDGYFHMASVNLETLHRLADQIYSKLLAPIDTQSLTTKLRFSDFVKAETKPAMTQGSIAFYKVKGYNAKKFDLKEFMVMISGHRLSNNVVDFGHVNLVSPVHIFVDTVSANFLATTSELPMTSNVTTTMAILRYTSLVSLSAYMKEVKRLMKSAHESYDRIVCYILAQILNGLLYMYDSETGFPVTIINARNVLVATPCGSLEKIIILNTHSRADHNPKLQVTDVSLQVTELLNILLAPPPHTSEGRRLSRQNSSRYTRGFQCIQTLLEDCTLLDDLITARNVAELMLWGPKQSDLMILKANPDMELACSVWLETQRCQMVNRFALQEVDRSIEEANYIKFLCAATGIMVHDALNTIEDGGQL